jgi:hypothetical protein
VPEAFSASAREPASIQRPTVEVEAPGMVSVATERPFERTEVRVMGSAEAGVASARTRVCKVSYMHAAGCHSRARPDCGLRARIQSTTHASEGLQDRARRRPRLSLTPSDQSETGYWCADFARCVVLISAARARGAARPDEGK